MLREGKGAFESVPVKAEGADAFAVRCGKKVYVYAYNVSDKPVTAVSIQMKGRHKVVPFDFGKSVFQDGKKIGSHDGRLVIPTNLPPRSEILFEIK
jgi:hypothetical protein